MNQSITDLVKRDPNFPIMFEISQELGLQLNVRFSQDQIIYRMGGYNFTINGDQLCMIHRTSAMFDIPSGDTGFGVIDKKLRQSQLRRRKFSMGDPAFLDNLREHLEVLNNPDKPFGPIGD